MNLHIHRVDADMFGTQIIMSLARLSAIALFQIGARRLIKAERQESLFRDSHGRRQAIEFS